MGSGEPQEASCGQDEQHGQQQQQQHGQNSATASASDKSGHTDVVVDNDARSTTTTTTTTTTTPTPTLALGDYAERNTPHFEVRLPIKRVLFEGKSAFQDVKVIETHQFGKTLALDGKTQSAAFDERLYHETLVHPAMLLHPCPKTVYIGGGGELATAREVLRHASVERVVMVDLDETVVEICKQHLPEWGAGCTEDPRLELHFADAHAYLREHAGTFDVIIMDIADPIEAGPGIVLYTQEFYAFAATRLNPRGVLVTQSGACSLYNFEECFTAIHNTLKASFQCVRGYCADVPSFAGLWGFNVAFNEGDQAAYGGEEALGAAKAAGAGLLREDFADWAPAELDAVIARRLPQSALRHYDGVAHRGMFALPKAVREGLTREERIITVANPVFMY